MHRNIAAGFSEIFVLAQYENLNFRDDVEPTPFQDAVFASLIAFHVDASCEIPLSNLINFGKELHLKQLSQTAQLDGPCVVPAS